MPSKKINKNYIRFLAVILIILASIFIFKSMPASFFAWFIDAPETKAAFITGCFTLVSALTVLTTAWVGYKQVHVPIKDSEVKNFAMFYSFVKSNFEQIKIIINMLEKIEEIPNSNFRKWQCFLFLETSRTSITFEGAENEIILNLPSKLIEECTTIRTLFSMYVNGDLKEDLVKIYDEWNTKNPELINGRIRVAKMNIFKSYEICDVFLKKYQDYVTTGNLS